MIEVKQFQPRQLFCIKVNPFGRDNNTLVNVLESEFIHDGLRPEFRYSSNTPDTLGIMWFETHEMARQWIDEFIEDFGYTRDQAYVVPNKFTTIVGMRVPVSYFEYDAWVNLKEWESTPSSIKSELANKCPDYFSADDDSDDYTQFRDKIITDKYRGFKF